MPRAAYYLSEPNKRTSCVVFASPHSGSDYPDWFLKQTVLNPKTIRSSEDAFVDLLFQDVADYGAPFLKAGAPRAFLDLNRSPEELDPALIVGVRKPGHNPRVASGLGVIPRVVANGRAIYRGKLPMSEAKRRIDGYWHPYHARLQSLLNESYQMFGEAILVDCHSMPHEALDSVCRKGGKCPDIVLGDRFGAAASPEIVDEIESAFAAAGLTVMRNTPFAGAYVTQAYGRPSRKQHAVQIEIDRSIYMDEKRVRPNADFDQVRALLSQVAARIVAFGQGGARLAAE
ncbi:N-formylglutamate amidohydrolase [Falsiruegeria litorea R37]|uniref:N-formylglutamate amidohydrolase n=1 Tax=Falsiruegeria litorea R37 TaxID=1200284 RepID=A0A1Y5TGE6_9RHOB|nr:N-formylglutamate amidohydrolase [Falsiruegeria litorea]SLN59827.1 N-formylglutamate amidohydrolase [Falsiruegeria litorea R37]